MQARKLTSWVDLLASVFDIDLLYSQTNILLEINVHVIVKLVEQS